MRAAERDGPRLRFRDPLAMAVMEVVRERGYERSRVEEFLARAGLGRAEFERTFSGKADLTLAVMQANMADFRSRVGAAFAGEPSWPASLRAAGWEVVRWIRDYPESVWFDMVGVLGAGDMVRVRREELFRWGTGLIDAGRAVCPDPDAVPRSTPILVVGATVEAVRRHEEGTLLDRTHTSVPQLMYAAVRPYLGEEAALAELRIPPPEDLR